MKFLRNAWYVVGFDDELVAGQMLVRTLLEEPVVLFRKPDGSAKALADRCAHRFAPLSAGVLVDGGEAIMCRYHGLRFDCTGTCVHSPQGSAPKAAKVRSYPVIERDRLLWIWMGDAALADVTQIPDYSAITRAPEHGTIRGYMPTACAWDLFIDNILDLSHVDYLHATTLGSGALSRTKAEVTEPAPRSVCISWVSSGEPAPPAFDMNLKRQGQPTDQWTDVTWIAPATMLLHAGATLQGEPRSAGAGTANLHIATPETATSVHYWYWSTRDFAVNAEANAHIKPIVEGVFRNEDKPMLEDQQRRIGTNDLWELKPVLLPADVGVVRVRRRLQALIDAEAQGTPATPQP